jgi:tetratricopeptide (TPR) repeat protein
MFLSIFLIRFILGISLGEQLFLSSLDNQLMAKAKYNQADTIQLITSSQNNDIDETSRLDQSLELINQMDESELKIIILNDLALNYAQLGKKEKAIAILDESLAMANNLEDVVLKVSAMFNLAKSYQQIGERKQAIEILDDIVELVNMFENVVSKVTTMLDLAQYYAQIGKKNQAIEIFENTADIANNIADKTLQGQLLLKISLTYGEIGEPEVAQTLLTQSQTTIAVNSQPLPVFPFTETPATLKLGFSGWINSFRDTEALVGVDVDFSKQWSEDDILVDGSIFLEYDSSNSVNNYRPGSLNFTFYRHHFNEKWSFAANFFNSINQSLYSSKNDDQDLAVNSVVLVGGGLNLWRGDSRDNFLDLQIAVGTRYQYDYIDFKLRRNQLDPALALILWGRGFSLGEANINELFVIMPNLNNFNQYEIVSDTELSFPLSQKWSFTNRLFLRYTNELVFEENPKVLFLFTTGLEYKF